MIEKTLSTLPDSVDTIIVVDDASRNSSVEIVKKRAEEDNRIDILEHKANHGVGGAIITPEKGGGSYPS